MKKSCLIISTGLLAGFVATACSTSEPGYTSNALDARQLAWTSDSGPVDYQISVDGSTELVSIDIDGADQTVAIDGDGTTIDTTYTFHKLELAQPTAESTFVQHSVQLLSLPDIPGDPQPGDQNTWLSGPKTTDDSIVQLRVRYTSRITAVNGAKISYVTVAAYQMTDNAAWEEAKEELLPANTPTEWMSDSWTNFRVTDGVFDADAGLLDSAITYNAFPSLPFASESHVRDNARSTESAVRGDANPGPGPGPVGGSL